MASSTWGQAQALPGFAALSHGPASATKLSCGSAGNCALAGVYTDSAGTERSFVASEVDGTWQKARPVPGIAALSHGRADDSVAAVSCAPSGYCVAGGTYEAASGPEAFLVSAVHGRWGSAEEVPGIAQLDLGGDAGLYAVSCTSAGNCTAGGGYTDAAGYGQAFVLSEHDGTWEDAQQVPGIDGASFLGEDPEIDSISCSSAGNCSASGDLDAGLVRAFVVNEQHGKWRQAELEPGSGQPSSGRAVVADVSCPSAGNCGAGGWYLRSGQQGRAGYHAFVLNEAGGAWGKFKTINGYADLHGYDLRIFSLSCGSPGNCSAVGTAESDFTEKASNESFVISEQDGTWGRAMLAPGVPVAPRNEAESFTLVSCAAAGDCSAGGVYPGNDGNAFLIDQTGGTWGNAEPVPGLDALDQGGSGDIEALSCASPGACSAAGTYSTPASPATAEIYVVGPTS